MTTLKTYCYFLAAFAAFFTSAASAFDVDGYGIVDTHYTTGDIFTDEEDGRYDWDLRRIKFSIKDDLKDNLKYKLSFKVNADKGLLEFDDAYLTYEPIKLFDIKLGRFKVPFGLENLQSTKTLPLFERSIASEVFTLSRSPGVSFQYKNSFFGVELGRFFRSAEDKDYEPGHVTSIRTRLFYGDHKDGLLHLGMGFNNEVVTDNKLRHEAVIVGGSVEDQIKGTKLSPNAINTSNFEIAGLFHYLTLQAELFSQRWVFEDDNPDKPDSTYEPDYYGSYMQAAVSFIGDGRRYEDGELEPDFKDGKFLEVAFRVNYVDLDYGDNRDYANSLDFAITYYPSKQIKLAAQYQRGDLVSGNVGDIRLPETGSAFSLRMQFMFD